MPRSAPTPCRQPGCPQVLISPGFCERHRSLQHRDYGRARRGFDQELGFYSSAAWRSTRAAVLRDQPLCRACQVMGRFVPAGVVDHVRPIKEGGERFDAANLQPLCVPCHNSKTARETARAAARGPARPRARPA